MTAWLVDPTRLPRLPPGTRALALRGQAVAASAFVAYDDAGLLAYRELLAGALVRHGRRVGFSITDIWVDSEASLAGGRALWAIPKEMARFSGGASGGRTDEAARAEAGADPGPIATARFGPLRLLGRRVPGLRLPVPITSRVVQGERGAAVASRIRARGRVRPAAASWELRTDGPLGWLAGARPLRHLLAEEFTLCFGPRLS